ncbi:hypothetical protein [Brasilonema sp. UFV-L1]|uniref:hypothetical protein n=1 Tax=Brasilonema sp. UFV-L1 TaxID=2234130 RepID=UPI00145C95E6|nr:hypothetical protein [Brasilonema sp. UFV-L1]
MSKANCVTLHRATRYFTFCKDYQEKVFKLLIVAITALGASFLSPQEAEAQSRSTSTPGLGNTPNYPYGTRINQQNGVINIPNGSKIYPATTINNGDGSTTYYYRNGTRIQTNSNIVSPNGALLRPGSFNGGLNPTPKNPNRRLAPTPGSSNGGLNN